MDEQDPTKKPPRKLKFEPRNPPKPRQPKIKASDEEDDPASDPAVKRVLKGLGRSKPKKKEKKADQVALGPGDSSSLRTYGSGSGQSSGIVPASSSEEQNVIIDSSAAEEQNVIIDSSADIEDSQSDGSDYKEPWDYEHTYYPVTLPLRRPNSGDPEKLDKKEFEDAATATNVKYDENTVNSARELGLLEQDNSEEPKMIFFQLPPSLPKNILDDQQKQKDEIGASTESTKAKMPKQKEKDEIGASKKSTEEIPLNKLPAGHLGKLLVYKSGKMKLKIGNTLFDVFSGTNPICAQDLVAVNTANKHCAVLGQISQKAVVAVDTDSLDSPDSLP